MRENGIVRYKCTVRTEPIDANGDPRQADVAWSDPLPCLVRTVSESRKEAYVDGEYRAVSMEVLVESTQPYCMCADSVKITRKGENLGEFRVIRTERLDTVGRIKILV